MRKAILSLVILMLAIPVRATLGWSEGGHHVIALIAFDRLSPEAQAEFNRLIESHPRFAEDFRFPKTMCSRPQAERWRVGRVGEWPDLGRQYPEYDRPTWHYEAGPTRTVGEIAKLNIPSRPGLLPADAGLGSQSLYLSQAVVLCQTVLQDKARPAAERALALSWLGHLVADAHQPCNAGSLYVEGIFPDGDQGAKSIPTTQDRNLHALWDGLLGKRFGTTSTNRRAVEIANEPTLAARGQAAIDSVEDMNVQTWLAESRDLAIHHVYTPEVIQAVLAAAKTGSTVPERLAVAKEYLSNAGSVAEVRAVEAGYRLAEIWKAGL